MRWLILGIGQISPGKFPLIKQQYWFQRNNATIWLQRCTVITCENIYAILNDIEMHLMNIYISFSLHPQKYTVVLTFYLGILQRNKQINCTLPGYRPLKIRSEANNISMKRGYVTKLLSVSSITRGLYYSMETGNLSTKCLPRLTITLKFVPDIFIEPESRKSSHIYAIRQMLLTRVFDTRPKHTMWTWYISLPQTYGAWICVTRRK